LKKEGARRGEEYLSFRDSKRMSNLKELERIKHLLLSLGTLRDGNIRREISIREFKKRTMSSTTCGMAV